MIKEFLFPSYNQSAMNLAKNIQRKKRPKFTETNLVCASYEDFSSLVVVGCMYAVTELSLSTLHLKERSSA